MPESLRVGSSSIGSAIAIPEICPWCWTASVLRWELVNTSPLLDPRFWQINTVRLLPGFAAPEDGDIRYDGKPLNGLRLDSVRRQIGTVLQTNTLFSGSLMEAIAGGCLIAEEEAWHAAELAGLADEIRAMPMGLQTMVPEGAEPSQVDSVSGGDCPGSERKPRILIFDEATSALDNRTQAIVTAASKRWRSPAS